MKAMYRLMPVTTLLILVGCTITDGGSIVTGVNRGPISVDEVRIYRTAPESYEEIAIVSASAGHDFKSNSALIDSAIQRLKEEAAKVGANGVLLLNIDDRDAPSTTTSIGNAQAYGNDGSSVYASGNSVSVNRGDTYSRIRGVAIYVEREQSEQREYAQAVSQKEQQENLEQSTGPDKYERLSKLGELRDAGILTEEEFQKLKKDILAESY